ncbi:uncharacterized protein AB675_5703 [Cyphellophora attinorum]|uniref:BTB domain-containing protein n=1 Tax=Cyphellophora attinorum TaxID=1664694 RepID=A0A0N1HWL8_9EURO|nr:uncharacterized protein AB675_5703 [Phialophora attinorum]KPI42074.1 hypothetical protein AB675_5703 [Phialophora attinorum]
MSPEGSWLPLAENVSPRAGTFLFAEVDPSADDVGSRYWIVLVVPERFLPRHMQDRLSRVGETIFPCWLMNWPGSPHQFKFLGKSKLYSLQADMMNSIRFDWKSHYRRTYQEATGAASHDSIAYYEATISEQSHMVNEQRRAARAIHAQGTGPHGRRRRRDDDDDDVLTRGQLPPRPRRQGRASDHSSQHMFFPEQSPPEPGSPSPEVISDQASAKPHIKTEEELAQISAISDVQSNKVVTIHAGTPNHIHRLPQAFIDKSPVLTAWLQPAAKLTDPWIMHPALVSVDSSIFAKLVQYLITNTYSPQVSAEPPLKLEGVEQSRASYSAELLKAGHLFILAEQFEIATLADHIYTKITTVEPYGYTRPGLLHFAEIIFSRPNFRDGVADTTIRRSDSSEVGEDKEAAQENPVDTGLRVHSQGMEEWVVSRLANELMDIMKYELPLWERVTAKTIRRGLQPRVFAAKAALDKPFGGPLVVIKDEN